MTTLEQILKLLEHCSDSELIEVAACCRVRGGPMFAAWWEQGRLTVHDQREADPVPLDWKPGVHHDTFPPEEVIPIKQTLPPSSMDETINKGRFK